MSVVSVSLPDELGEREQEPADHLHVRYVRVPFVALVHERVSRSSSGVCSTDVSVYVRALVPDPPVAAPAASTVPSAEVTVTVTVPGSVAAPSS